MKPVDKDFIIKGEHIYLRPITQADTELVQGNYRAGASKLAGKQGLYGTGTSVCNYGRGGRYAAWLRLSSKFR